MANFAADVLPKLKALKEQADQGRDMSGEEIRKLKDALNELDAPSLIKQNLGPVAKADCGICLGCGFFHPAALAVTAVAAG